MTQLLNPSLYQVNTRVWLTALSETLGRPAQLDDIRDVELDQLAGIGFDWVWFLGVWQTGSAQATGRAGPTSWLRSSSSSEASMPHGSSRWGRRRPSPGIGPHPN
jgi:hypothetical protein